MSHAVRSACIGGDGVLDERTRGMMAAALESFLDENIACDQSTIDGMLPQCSMNSSQMLDVFNTMANSMTLNTKLRREMGGGGQAAPNQVVTVRVGGADALFTDGDGAAEAISLARDAMEAGSSDAAKVAMKALEGYALEGDYNKLQGAMEKAGAPIYRLLTTPLVAELSRALTQTQWPEDAVATMMSCRAALARRQWLSVRGSSAGEPDADEGKAFGSLRQGKASWVAQGPAC